MFVVTPGAGTVSVSYQLLDVSSGARRGRLQTARGTVETPTFMAVGTAATVKAMTPEQVAATGVQVVLGNTYHLMVRPGAERIKALGGLHDFMNWPGVILTDSGGYQIWSLAARRKITEEGVSFRSHIDGALHHLTPERAIEIQQDLGSDIMMVLDECTAYPADHSTAEISVALSLRWAERCKAALSDRKGALFGIVQGGMYADLRALCAQSLTTIGFDGYAIGGLSVGEDHSMMADMTAATTQCLPVHQPRYLMGVGRPQDIIEAVARGVDMFDCVLPTRCGRTGKAFTWDGELNMRNACHAEDSAPLDPHSECSASHAYSRAYIHHLFKSGEILGPILLTWHNLHFYQDLMRAVRESIEQDHFAAFRAEALDRLQN